MSKIDTGALRAQAELMVLKACYGSIYERAAKISIPMAVNYRHAVDACETALDRIDALEAALQYIAETSDDQHVTEKARKALAGDA